MCILCGAPRPRSRLVASAVAPETHSPLGPIATGLAGPADVLLRGGIILPMTGAPDAAAIAVRAGRIQSVGDESAVFAHRGRLTRVIDLDGQTLLPGFVVAHWHMPFGPTCLRDLFAQSAASGITCLRVCGLGTLNGADELRLMRDAMQNAPRLRLRATLDADLLPEWTNLQLRPGAGDDFFRVDTMSAWSDGPNLAAARQSGWHVAVHPAPSAFPPSLGQDAIAGPPPPLAVLGDAVAAGMPAAQALAALTIDAATRCGVDKIVGSLERGKYADVVFLDRDPRIDPDATCTATWLNGLDIYRAPLGPLLT